MTFLLVILAFAALGAIGYGAALLRGNRRAPVTSAGQWFATLQGPRALGAGLIAGGVIAFILVLALRP